MQRVMVTHSEDARKTHVNKYTGCARRTSHSVYEEVRALSPIQPRPVQSGRCSGLVNKSLSSTTSFVMDLISKQHAAVGNCEERAGIRAAYRRGDVLRDVQARNEQLTALLDTRRRGRAAGMEARRSAPPGRCATRAGCQ